METSQEEKNMAALAQALGAVAALPVWLRWRKRSAFVRDHAAQSIVFDGVTLAALLLIAALSACAALAFNAALAQQAGGQNTLQLFLVMMCVPGLALIGLLMVMAAALVLRLRATLAANEGKLYRYPLFKGSSRS